MLATSIGIAIWSFLNAPLSLADETIEVMHLTLSYFQYTLASYLSFQAKSCVGPFGSFNGMKLSRQKFPIDVLELFGYSLFGFLTLSFRTDTKLSNLFVSPLICRLDTDSEVGILIKDHHSFIRSFVRSFKGR